MATESKSRRRRRKKVLRKNDGSLYDATERRRITHTELRDYVRDGGLFEARRQENGADCTYEVLQSVMGMSLMENLVPGLGGGTLPGLGGLSALAGGGPLAALGGGGGIGGLARLLGEQVGRSGEHNGDDWEEPRRRSPSHRSGEWDRDDGWSEGRSRRRSDDRDDWAGSDWSEEQPKRRHSRDRDWADPDEGR